MNLIHDLTALSNRFTYSTVFKKPSTTQVIGCKFMFILMIKKKLLNDRETIYLCCWFREIVAYFGVELFKPSTFIST